MHFWNNPTMYTQNLNIGKSKLIGEIVLLVINMVAGGTKHVLMLI
jgi:hypothetical protein